ncbi:MAM and LDL-receptor class A domain-containing protein 1-like [Haliotis rubra]|uniref:MAM and LDL-receptor class A domain-containing protein 1-like n=1 Tax=Haliotis rubra TaxID=36100 RepID=UPI001EE633A6|nr:MAM and LDL-receptor class A domain-containing protein 1-like [Haliotis rubra]
MFVLLLLLSLLQYGPGDTFDPGCSFMNGQCQYSVKLGHEGQCDTHTTVATPAGASCCAAVQNDVTLMKASMALMTKKIEELQNTKGVRSTSPYGDLSVEQLQRLLLEKEDELRNITKQASDEIRLLQSELDTCRKRPDCTRSTPMTTTSTTTVKPAVNYNLTFCDFDSSSTCGYTQASNNTAKWYRGSGRPSTVTGPWNDHTIGTPDGNYMYIDPHRSALWYKRETSALLESPLFNPSPDYCVQFWYNMAGRDIQDLNVYAKVGSGLGYPVWTRSGQVSAKWQLGEIDIGSEYTSKPFHLVFEGTSRSYYEHVFASDSIYHDTYGNIAIDDIYVYNTTCQNLPDCPPGAYRRTGNDSRSCYTFHTKPTRWSNCHEACKEENSASHLVAIDSEEEQKFLASIIKNDPALTAAGSSGFFTSGNDEETENNFRWTGMAVPQAIGYTNWYPGQPNNVGSNQHCLLMEYPNTDYEWGDNECSSSFPYICEVDLPLPSTATTTST